MIDTSRHAQPPHPQAIAPPRGPSILAVAAHPDDIESWCAGTLAGAIDAGATARVLLVTSGDKGTSDPNAHPADVAARREAEAREAAQRLGLAEVAFLRYPDAEVEDTPQMRRDLVTWIRRWRPEVVFTHDPVAPYPRYTSHRDHRIVGRAVLDAIYPLARDARAFPELLAAGLVPHTVQTAWLFSTDAPNALVDITRGFERKVQARLAHASQMSDAVTLRSSWHARAAAIGEPAELELAEAFAVVELG